MRKLSKEILVVLAMLTVIIIDMLFILNSQFVKEWYEGGSGDCKWKGDSEKIYSSKCYTHKDYSDTKCSACPCCSGEVSLTKLGHSILPLIIVMIFAVMWVINFIILLFKELDYEGYYLKLCKIFTIPAVFLAIIEFSVESFGITDEKIKAGMVLRIISLIIFAFFAIALFQLSNSLRNKKNESLFNDNVTALPLIKEQSPARVDIRQEKSPFIPTAGAINKDDSFNEEI